MTATIHALEQQLATLEANPNHDLRHKIDTLNTLAKELRHTNAACSVAYSQQAYALSCSGSFAADCYIKGLAASLLNLSIHAYLAADYRRSLAQLHEARQLAETSGDLPLLAEALVNMAHTYTTLGDHPVALKYALQAVATCQAAEARQEEADAYNKLGIIHGKVGNLQQALEALQTSVAIYREIAQPSGEAILLNDIAMTHKMLGNYADALTAPNNAWPWPSESR